MEYPEKCQGCGKGEYIEERYTKKLEVYEQDFNMVSAKCNNCGEDYFDQLAEELKQYVDDEDE